MRSIHIIGFFVIIIGAFTLFEAKYYINHLDDEMNKITFEVQNNLKELRDLETEWGYLNNPCRLRSLANRYLKADFITYSQAQDGWKEIIKNQEFVKNSKKTLDKPLHNKQK